MKETRVGASKSWPKNVSIHSEIYALLALESLIWGNSWAQANFCHTQNTFSLFFLAFQRGGVIVIRVLSCVLLCSVAVSGCNTWSTANVTPASNVALAQNAERTPKNPANVVVTENDITNRPYKVLGDIRVKVNKTTIFNKDPEPADVDHKLRQKAAKIGADAVVLVRYGSVGMSALSWGSLSGNGRAVVFTN